MTRRRRVRGEPRRSQEATWDWRKRYRVWDANRKVFVYPESWLEPDDLPPVVRCLAPALRLDLYRVGLTTVASEYIGETEKNLERVFDAAAGRARPFASRAVGTRLS